MENKSEKKKQNNWGELFTNVGSKVLVLKNRDGKTVFEIDLVIAFILALFVNVLVLIFLILIVSGNITFETKMKG